MSRLQVLVVAVAARQAVQRRVVSMLTIPPAIMAGMASTVDAISGGRFAHRHRLGLAKGEYPLVDLELASVGVRLRKYLASPNRKADYS
jgi:hypothetical protein